jgi:L-alanine-DL-glutamate epimerase-like enolase superfamily enzyme
LSFETAVAPAFLRKLAYERRGINWDALLVILHLRIDFARKMLFCLGPMKLSFRRHELQLAHPWRIARGSATEKVFVVVVELTGADGTTGLGEAAPISRYKESADTVEAFLKKVDPRGLSFNDIEGSMTYLDTISPHDMAAKCAVNLALLDAAGKRAGKPVYDLLELGFRENQHVSSFTIGIDEPGMIRKKVLEAQHFPVLKIKLGVPEDKEHLRAVREILPEKPIRVDANEGWKTKEHALEMIEALAHDGHVQYVEQPMPAGTPFKDWTWLKQRSPLPLFADESFHLARDIDQAAQCFHGVNVKLVKTAGITGGLESLRAARKAELKTMIGCMVETSVLVSAAAQLAELCDFLDLDGHILIKNDPYLGVSVQNGAVSFAGAPEKAGLRVKTRE